MKIEFSKAASLDLEEIYFYGFINFGEDLADEYSNLIGKNIDNIAIHPEIGRLDMRINPAVRRLEAQSHIIFYDIKPNIIFIVRILHKSMDFLRHL